MLQEGLNKVLPDNAHNLCTGKLKISLTRVGDGKNVIVSDFHTKEELIQVSKDKNQFESSSGANMQFFHSFLLRVNTPKIS